MVAPVIPGWDPSYRRPRFIAQIVFGAGQLSAAIAPLLCLMIGMKTSAGTIVADAAPIPCVSDEEADTKSGAGSQLARMAYKALKYPGVNVYLAAVTEPGGGTAATATIVLATIPTSAGTVEIWIAGEKVTIDVPNGTAIDTVGADIASKINAKTRLPVTAAYDAPSDTVTITCKNKGTQSKDWLVHINKSVAPSGMTLTLTGSAAAGTDRVRMGASASGTGDPDITTLLTQMLTGRYARIACGFNDAANLALLETHVNTKGGVLSMLYEHFIVGANNDYATAQARAQTTMNAQRGQLLWHRNSESHPCEIAASKAGLRATTENATPVPDYDGIELLGIAPHRYESDRPTDTEINTALQNSVTPVDTADGKAVVVRSITSYSLLAGSTADDRTLDIGDAVMPDYAALDLQATYATFRAANPYVGPDPATGAAEPPAGVATPKRWNVEAQARYEFWFQNNWSEDPALNPPVSQYSTSYKAIVCTMPLVVRRVQHQLGVIVRQTAV